MLSRTPEPDSQSGTSAPFQTRTPKGTGSRQCRPESSSVLPVSRPHALKNARAGIVGQIRAAELERNRPSSSFSTDATSGKSRDAVAGFPKCTDLHDAAAPAGTSGRWQSCSEVLLRLDEVARASQSCTPRGARIKRYSRASLAWQRLDGGRLLERDQRLRVEAGVLIGRSSIAALRRAFLRRLRAACMAAARTGWARR